VRRTHLLLLAVAAATLLIAAPARAQLGHPLKGQWSGQWGPADHSHRLLLDLNWDGKEMSGVVNPGPESATVKSVTFDYSNPAAWKVRIEAERKDASGKTITIVADGTLENIGAYNKLYHGTWTEDGQKGDFTLTRN
jgi:hypothetical protein